MQEILDDQFLEEKPKGQERNKWFYFFLALLLTGSIISSMIAWYHVESIIRSGPIMSGIGIIVFLSAIKIKSRKALFLGFFPLIISTFWIFAINTCSLSPSDCKTYLPASLSLATIFMLYIGFPLFKKY